ncbi:MAG: hypothetical protein K6F09_09765, partial [Clostridiales bacterium]|nr:hypothetical protein [Clostridiales bacterium]
MAKKSDGKNLNGEGTVYQVNENKWCASIRLGRDSNGKPIRKQFTGKTERAVRSKLAQFKRDENAMKTVSLGKITVGEYAEKFMEMKKRVLKPLSYDRLNSVM